MNRVVFSPKQLSQTVDREFDFSSLLAEGETLSYATIDVETHAGTDSNPEAILSGGVELDSPRVRQALAGGTLGAVYTLTCVIGTCNGQVLSLAAYLAVVKDADE